MCLPRNLIAITQFVLRVACVISVIDIEVADCFAVEMSDVREAVTKYQNSVWACPGGIEMKYDIDIVQDESKPVIAYSGRIHGRLVLLNDKIFVLTKGDMFAGDADGKQIVIKDHIREAVHDFGTGVGIAHDGTFLAQACNFRHNFSSKLGFPLIWQSFERMDQFYDSTKPSKGDYWLPSALEHPDYQVGGTQNIEGEECIIVARQDRDKLWLARDKGFAVAKREVSRDTPECFEQFSAGEFRKVNANIWFPLRQSYSVQYKRTGNKAAMKLVVASFRVGQSTEADLKVVIPEEVEEIEDHVEKFTAKRGDVRNAFVEVRRSLKEGSRELEAANRSRRFWLACVAIGIGSTLGGAFWWRKTQNAYENRYE